MALIQKKPDTLFLEFFEELAQLLDVLSSKEQFSLAFERLTKKIATYVNAETCRCYLWSEEENAFSRAFSTKPDDSQNLMHFYFNKAIFEEVMTTGLPYVSNDFEGNIPNNSSNAITVRSILCYPLVKEKKKIGIIELINKLSASGFGEEDKQFLNSLSRPLNAIISGALLFQNTELLCYMDDVTKLYNSRYLKQSIGTEIKRSLRYKKKVSLLFLDIDCFKSVNDSYGHLVGSETLTEVAVVLKNSVRGTDIVARYGGDEFVIILPETSLEEAMVIAERIRRKVERYRFGTKRNLKISLTLSIGIATCPKHALTSEGLLQKADTAMYQAKNTVSKNTICVAV